MIRFGEEVCRNLDSALRCEWLETNGIGEFASGTINGCNSRRHHGPLVAATKPPVGRFLLLSKSEKTLIVNGRRYELGTNRYPGVVHPQGLNFLTQFGIDPVGCIAQAWSVAELLRAAVEDVCGILPRQAPALVGPSHSSQAKLRASGSQARKH